MVFGGKTATGIFVFAGLGPVGLTLGPPLKTWPMLKLIENEAESARVE